MPERESFMKLRSSKAAICTGAAVVMFLMPVVPEVAVAKTTYEQPESTVQFDTELRQASYTVNVSDIVATGYVEEKETGMYPVILQDLLRQVNYVLMKKHRHLEAA